MDVSVGRGVQGIPFSQVEELNAGDVVVFWDKNKFNKGGYLVVELYSFTAEKFMLVGEYGKPFMVAASEESLRESIAEHEKVFKVDAEVFSDDKCKFEIQDYQVGGRA